MILRNHERQHLRADHGKDIGCPYFYLCPNLSVMDGTKNAKCKHYDVCGTKMHGLSVILPTGDSAYIVMTFLLMLICVPGISVVALLRKKR